MSNYWDSVDYVTLPVKLVDGVWELLYGGTTGVKSGTCGELRVTVSSIEDEVVRQRLTQVVTVKVFDEDTELLVALRDREQPQSRGGHPAIDRTEVPMGCTRFESIRIGASTPSTDRIEPTGGGLWIRQRGVDRTDLLCSGVRMPNGFEPAMANSLNHACTLLSERYETHRISHTLNVYQHVFYRESGERERWRPLEVLRNGNIADMERSIMADAWRRLEEQLGFRPIGKVDRRQRRQGR